MKNQDKGIHHISIIAGDPQVNIDFYVKVLGLRMVLKTVNQDDPSTYHLFYANGEGRPGSSITFFPWPMAVQSKPGTGQVGAISFSVPKGSQEYWIDRFSEKDVPFGTPIVRFGNNILPFKDPDGLKLELVEESPADTTSVWKECPVSEEHAISGFWGSTLRLTQTESTRNILQNVMEYELAEEVENLTLLQTSAALGHSIILEKEKHAVKGKNGRGTVHHIAFRANDEKDLREMREQVTDMGLSPTEIIDRHVFKSVYFQTPDGVLFEIATDGPGYASVAENKNDMGKSLFLPPWLEPKREMIEKRLQPVKVD